MLIFSIARPGSGSVHDEITRIRCFSASPIHIDGVRASLTDLVLAIFRRVSRSTEVLGSTEPGPPVERETRLTGARNTNPEHSSEHRPERRPQIFEATS